MKTSCLYGIGGQDPKFLWVFSSALISLTPSVTQLLVSLSLEFGQYILRNHNHLQRHMAGRWVRLPPHRRALSGQLLPPPHGHVHHSRPKDPIRAFRPLVRRPRPLCWITLRRISILRTSIFGIRSAAPFPTHPVGSYHHGPYPNVLHRDERTRRVLCYHAPLRVVGAREAGRNVRSVEGLGTVHLDLGEKRACSAYF